MDQIQKEFELALGAIIEERAHDSQSMQRLHTEKAQETSKLQQAITAKDKALVENQRLERELCQIQQQQESVNVTMQDQLSWNDIQPVLHQAHGELTSAATRFWNTIESLHNYRVASYLPGSGVIHGTWPDQDGPLVSLGHDALPGFSASSDFPLATQQAPDSTNQYASLV
jgi:small-conductance mechanosensitive channel